MYSPLFNYRSKPRKPKACKCCGKLMPNAHPNKKFCSNRGAGNCKDRYHNLQNPDRLVRIGINLDDHGHPFAAGADGHGQE